MTINKSSEYELIENGWFLNPYYQRNVVMVNDDAFLLKQIEYEVWSALRKQVN